MTPPAPDQFTVLIAYHWPVPGEWYPQTLKSARSIGFGPTV